MASIKEEYVTAALEAKRESSKSFEEIAAATGLTNVYAAQLFHLQAQLKPKTMEKLLEVVPDLPDEVIQKMMECPKRSFSKELIQDPFIYRLYEAVMHNGEAMRAVANEKFGDGIMSAIDFYCTVDKIKGVNGETRAVITFNGKFLPHVEGLAENNTATLSATSLD